MLTFLAAHLALVLLVLGQAVAVLKLTHWGRANSRALELVARAVESAAGQKADADAVRHAVAGLEASMEPAVRDALHDALAEFKAGWRPRSALDVFWRELARGLAAGGKA